MPGLCLTPTAATTNANEEERMEEVTTEEAVKEQLLSFGFTESVLPFLPLNMTLLEKEQVNYHWVFNTWECDENCRYYSTVADGVEYNTTVHDVKRTVTSPLCSLKTTNCLTVLYGGKEYYIVPQNNRCTTLRKQIIRVCDSGCDS